MIGFGQILREAREAQMIELTQVERETLISADYLKALENEHLYVFPAETYLLGFLKNYAEYLNLDAQEIILIYKKIKIQQAAAPEGLLIKKSKSVNIPVKKIILTFCILLIITALANTAFFTLKKVQARKETKTITPKNTVYTAQNTPLEVTLYKGDVIEVPLENSTAEIKVTNTLSFLTLQTPNGSQTIEQGEETDIDADDKKGAEITVFVKKISKSDSLEGAAVTLFLSKAHEPAVQTEILAENIVLGNTVSQNRRINIFESNSAYPVTFSATFRSNCLLRYQSDRQESVESLYSTGDTLVVQANNGMRVWISNANAIKIQLIGGGKTVDLEAGKPGQVLVQDIRWLRDEDGKYRLAVIEVE